MLSLRGVVPVGPEATAGCAGSQAFAGPSVCASVPSSVSLLPLAKGSADLPRFPRVFRGYAERKRRKRENDSASVIQR